MTSDSVAYRNVVSNGLVLDKEGNKMSKRVGNVVNPFETIDSYGADSTRWYMIANAQPWDNLKFDIAGIKEVQRKFFGTLFNTYSFFALYANIDQFKYLEDDVPTEELSELDRWIISLLNSLIKDVDSFYDDYEPTKAARAIQEFSDDHLSNWYVRLSRRRFWKGEYSKDKIAAYQTLYKCLTAIAQLMSPVSPFFSDFLFRNLNEATGKHLQNSIHLTDFPKYNEKAIDKSLEERMRIAQNISSMVLSLRKKVNIKVRQPLNKILVPILDDNFKDQLEKVRDLILTEVNVKDLEYVTDTSGVISKKIKPDFNLLGKKWGSKMKEISASIAKFKQEDIVEIEKNGTYELKLKDEVVPLLLEEVEIGSEDIPGWLGANMGTLTVALDVTLTAELKEEGVAREFINRIQKLRKEKGFEITDRITLNVQNNREINSAIINNMDYICSEVLAVKMTFVDELDGQHDEVIVNETKIQVNIKKRDHGKESD